MSKDPREILANSPMNAFQVVAVAICIGLNALDGFDVLSISFASPGIASEWGINRAELGLVLAMELVGMAVGSVWLGGLADRYGRRPTIIGCLLVMTLGMYSASLVNSVNSMLAVRFATGLGIGGMLAAINAMVAEYSNTKRKNLSLSLMVGGYPIGAIVGGSVASLLLVYFDWRAVFVFGSLATATFLVLVWFWLPESIEYLMDKRPPNALERINSTLRRMGHETVDVLPEAPPKQGKAGLRKLFSPQLMTITIVLTVAYFAHIMTFYYIIKWIPKLVVDMGYDAARAGGALVWANVGGAIGALGVGLLGIRFNIRNLLIGVLLISFVMVSVFGLGQDTLLELILISAFAGIFTNGGVVGLYTLFARAFPSDVRASGTGFAIGVGRGGAALGPVAAGFLFNSGFGLLPVSMIMACGALVAAVVLFKISPSLVSNK